MSFHGTLSSAAWRSAIRILTLHPALSKSAIFSIGKKYAIEMLPVGIAPQ